MITSKVTTATPRPDDRRSGSQLYVHLPTGIIVLTLPTAFQMALDGDPRAIVVGRDETHTPPPDTSPSWQTAMNRGRKAGAKVGDSWSMCKPENYRLWYGSVTILQAP